MAKIRTLEAFRDALQALLDLEEDGEIEAWERRVHFELDTPHTKLWDDLDRDAPPKVFLLMTRPEEDAFEFAWRHKPGLSLDNCPIVEMNMDGDTQVLAPNAKAYIHSILYSNGSIGGGTTDDLIDARTEATRNARSLSDALQDELDVSLPHPDDLGDAWEDLQEELADAWADAAEGLE